MSKKMNDFSVGLGLFDYINPIFYSITSITILLNLYSSINKALLYMMCFGALISLIFGFTIPTVKLLVGLGKMEFKMPVNLVCYVNSGIFLFGIGLITHIYKLSIVTYLAILFFSMSILFFIYNKTKKFNTIAVLIGTVGYIMIYTSLITLAIKSSYYISVVLYAIAIMLFIFLCLVGIFSDLKKPRVHWAIEIANVLCQFLVALSTVLLFIK